MIMAKADVKKLFILLSDRPQSYTSLKLLIENLGWQVVVVSSVASLDQYVGEANQTICLAILNPKRALAPIELRQIRQHLLNGSLIVASGDNEDNNHITSLNKLLIDYGVRFNADCVIRPNLYELYHPKEAALEDFAVNRGLLDVLRKHLNQELVSESQSQNKDLIKEGIRIIYPRGCTLLVDKKRSTVMMNSSRLAIPTEQVICAFNRADKEAGSRLIALGSAELMSDNYIDKEQNRALVKTLLEFIDNENFPINLSDSKTVEIPRYTCTANMDYLTNLPIPCLPAPKSLPEDLDSLINRKLFSIDSSMIPTVVRAFKDLKVKHEPLSLIKPSFEGPVFKLEPMVHNFLLRN